ncbi:MAG TPA: L,D-transpeptidase [Pyrinomonadaceae bacterium]|nr:L,D-transpeptidase [Pyrinomonadaceae bacterium]
MSKLLRATARAARFTNGRGTVALLVAFALAGCQSAPVSNVNTNAPQSSSASPSPARADNAGANQQPVTLAVLDALFADESFAQELKSKAGLTDEQIAGLRKVAEEERGGLRESEGEDHAGTTTAATERARQRITAAVGQEKADQIFAFAGERWGGGEASAASQPNGVPTDTRIVVNAPAFRMDVFESGRLVKTYKVGIGYPEFPLPAGLRKADTIIYNPAWIPPDEPWVEAPGSKVKVGEKVDPGSPLNPLGPIKIPIGLPSLIHGGKSPARLGQFASHGCVGLTNPQVEEFARDLARLSGTQLTDEQVAEYKRNKKETKNVKLSNPIMVELRYETIVATNDGKLHVYRDVYDRGTNTEENLRRVLQAHGLTLEQLAEHERSRALEAVRQMARDATGRPAEGDGVDNSNVVDKPANDNANNSNSKNANSNSNAKNTNSRRSSQPAERVTRTVKGEREITIDIAALQGKGYPVPVNLNPPEKDEKKGSEGGKRNENSTGAQRRRTS